MLLFTIGKIPNRRKSMYISTKNRLGNVFSGLCADDNIIFFKGQWWVCLGKLSNHFNVNSDELSGLMTAYFGTTSGSVRLLFGKKNDFRFYSRPHDRGVEELTKFHSRLTPYKIWMPTSKALPFAQIFLGVEDEILEKGFTVVKSIDQTMNDLLNKIISSLRLPKGFGSRYITGGEKLFFDKAVTMVLESNVVIGNPLLRLSRIHYL